MDKETPPQLDQIEDEFIQLLEYVKGKKLILEVGTEHGGSLYRFLQVADDNAVVVAVDLNFVIDMGVMNSWCKPGQTLYLVQGDSHDESIVNAVKNILAGCKFDFTFIDGGHTYEDVKADFENYSPMSEMVAFHDITHHPNMPDVGVDRFWAGLHGNKAQIVHVPTQGWAGIGVWYPIENSNNSDVRERINRMKMLYKFMAVWVICVMAVIGCTPKPSASGYDTPNGKLQNGKPIRFIGVNRSHPVVRVITLGFQEACRDLGVVCENNAAEGVDFALFAANADIAIAQGTSGAIPFIDKAVYETDKKLIAAGIPLVNIHGSVNKDELPGVLGWVAADNVAYAKAAAEAIGAKMGGKGIVAVTQGSLNDVENVVNQTFTAYMAEKYPGITVLSPEMEGFDQPAAIAVAAAMLQKEPGITAAFGTTGNSPTTWAKAAESIGKKPGEIIIIGMDYTAENLALIKSKQVYAVVGQPLYEETYKAVELLVAHLQGKEIPYSNVIAAPIITLANVDKYLGYADRVKGLAK